MAETTEEELKVLAAKAGLEGLPAEYRAELLSAYRHLEVMLARIRQDRPQADEPAHVFVAATFARKA
ncbi:hypothetical protein JYK14_11575 [Siccirubricoccus sp. KC 17139]|uniref:DUF4089 domain-containing protein n=1 Tax=Siccirubricoccus soli TaxID=2899147 RepID=A0ABT1D4K0_9PROT|nr:hypothetical protein [Siccirubricoccus soli]MCO6416794.1 hypothetical protein [Siccirubricoccus soli]MCP2682929.1 hypothetical protein [Siccirubricoccus soli]